MCRVVHDLGALLLVIESVGALLDPILRSRIAMILKYLPVGFYPPKL
jgi:hypothetical protein